MKINQLLKGKSMALMVATAIVGIASVGCSGGGDKAEGNTNDPNYKQPLASKGGGKPAAVPKQGSGGPQPAGD